MLFPADIKPLLPLDADSLFPELEESVRRHGCIAPVLVTGNLLVDGHKRVALGRRLGLDLPWTEVGDGDPWILYWRLNQGRGWSLTEVTTVLAHLQEAFHKDFLASLGWKYSPDLVAVLRWVGATPGLAGTLSPTVFSPSVLRDLGHLDDDLAMGVSLLQRLSGTAGEFRLIAGLLRRVKERGDDLEGLKTWSGCLADLRQYLENLLEPRRSALQKRFQEVQERILWPRGVEVRVDPVFEKPGISVRMHVTRARLDRLDELREALQQLFEAMEDL